MLNNLLFKCTILLKRNGTLFISFANWLHSYVSDGNSHNHKDPGSQTVLHSFLLSFQYLSPLRKVGVH